MAKPKLDAHDYRSMSIKAKRELWIRRHRSIDLVTCKVCGVRMRPNDLAEHRADPARCPESAALRRHRGYRRRWQ